MQKMFVVATFGWNKFWWVRVAHCNYHVTNFSSVQTFLGVAGSRKLDLNDYFCIYSMSIYMFSTTIANKLWPQQHGIIMKAIHWENDLLLLFVAFASWMMLADKHSWFILEMLLQQSYNFGIN